MFDLSTVYPLVLAIMGADTTNDELAGMLEDLESYIFRRAVCNLGTKNYNRFFLTVLNKLSSSKFDRVNLRAALCEQRGGPVFRNRMAAWLRWILGSITPPISRGLPA
jgi:hypothetical protein